MAKMKLTQRIEVVINGRTAEGFIDYIADVGIDSRTDYPVVNECEFYDSDGFTYKDTGEPVSEEDECDIIEMANKDPERLKKLEDEAYCYSD